MTGRVLVTGPVTAEVGPVYLRLFPGRDEFVPPDNGYWLPWACGALCRVKFTIGQLTVTKRITTKHVFSWQDDEPPPPAERQAARESVLADMRVQLRRHGFEPPELRVIEDG